MKSMAKTEARFWDRVRIGDGCWEWQGHLDRDGYGRVRLDGRRMRTNRAAWEFSHGVGSSGTLQVCHRCDNRRCVRPGHLFLGSNADNMADKVAKGRQARGVTHVSRTQPHRLARGERQGSARLTADNVLEIRERRAAGETLSSIGRDLGIAISTVSGIARLKSWAHVGGGS